MNKRLSILLAAASISGCTSVSPLYVKRGDIDKIGHEGLVTFSDYGNEIQKDEHSELYKYVVYIGGFGGCKKELLHYAKPKMDQYMVDHGFKDYVVVKTSHITIPPTRCELLIQYQAQVSS